MYINYKNCYLSRKKMSDLNFKNMIQNINKSLKTTDKNNIYLWSQQPFVKEILNDTFSNFIKILKINKYGLILEEDIVFNKFISLIYHLNII